ncbi:SANT/Myb-like DNA-binding domain-containing protein ASCRUDRAFT_72730 [Ascoidea rubescens DSM 1968]|uniref:Myb-like domain-containing protein n=1 Tax=Ascoidea rubescens DSM 1968 TaxID=1344418 RepID=A0A1D2V9J7_9ASCO|nr:hypothetical protein ASCRUDRAFT_72730 [Ascoidea rubescens DSM 1968]ODV58316.1 hypothetical protein ASCRUDRAFT_72730 [Ascoidea rubescens DSM 1968]
MSTETSFEKNLNQKLLNLIDPIDPINSIDCFSYNKLTTNSNIYNRQNRQNLRKKNLVHFQNINQNINTNTNPNDQYIDQYFNQYNNNQLINSNNYYQSLSINNANNSINNSIENFNPLLNSIYNSNHLTANTNGINNINNINNLNNINNYATNFNGFSSLNSIINEPSPITLDNNTSLSINKDNYTFQNLFDFNNNNHNNNNNHTNHISNINNTDSFNISNINQFSNHIDSIDINLNQININNNLANITTFNSLNPDLSASINNHDPIQNNQNNINKEIKMEINNELDTNFNNVYNNNNNNQNYYHAYYQNQKECIKTVNDTLSNSKSGKIKNQKLHNIKPNKPTSLFSHINDNNENKNYKNFITKDNAENNNISNDIIHKDSYDYNNNTNLNIPRSAGSYSDIKFKFYSQSSSIPKNFNINNLSENNEESPFKIINFTNETAPNYSNNDENNDYDNKKKDLKISQKRQRSYSSNLDIKSYQRPAKKKQKFIVNSLSSLNLSKSFNPSLNTASSNDFPSTIGSIKSSSSTFASTPKSRHSRWTKADDDLLIYYKEQKNYSWREISLNLNNKYTWQSIQMRYLRTHKNRFKNWTVDDLKILKEIINDDWNNRFKRIHEKFNRSSKFHFSMDKLKNKLISINEKKFLNIQNDKVDKVLLTFNETEKFLLLQYGRT